jgi:hypothetical protein
MSCLLVGSERSGGLQARGRLAVPGAEALEHAVHVLLDAGDILGEVLPLVVPAVLEVLDGLSSSAVIDCSFASRSASRS